MSTASILSKSLDFEDAATVHCEELFSSRYILRESSAIVRISLQSFL